MLRINQAAHDEATPAKTLRSVGSSFLNDWRYSAYALILVSLLLIIFSSLAHGDDLTGQPVDDPKDLAPSASTTTTTTTTLSSGLFVPMPAWAHGVIMPPLPIELKPMGGKTKLAGPPPAPVGPPKDQSSLVSTPSPATGKSASGAADTNAAMVTVSPFLQWIKSNPQAAAAQARQQADAYHAGAPAPTATGTDAASTAPRAPAATAGDAQDPYWLPPLIDSPDFGPVPVTGSAAIYSTPQR